MSEFFLELFSEEIPPNLQISARENLISNFTGFFEQKKINYPQLLVGDLGYPKENF